MLNYGYALMISLVHRKIVAIGLDPSIGIAHRRHTNQIPLIYDLIEPLRPIVDRQILSFAISHTFSPGDFSINRRGGCRLNPQMVKIAINQLNAPEVSAGINSILDWFVQ